MLTTRGWWCLVIILAVLTLGVLDSRWTLTMVALTLLLWFLAQWLVFALRVRFALPALAAHRRVSDDRGPVETLWAGRVFRVHVEVQHGNGLALPYLRWTDVVPFGVERIRGESAAEGVLADGNRLALDYSVRCLGAGRILFGGVTIEIADFQGFFYHATFVPCPQEYRVLPPLADARGHRPTVKRNNLLPSPGLHRHLRPGSGSELLDLRDYLPGDPPKTIAWKISARRDRLITKEFESEVPVRCTLFVDTSQSVRLGLPGRNALARIVDIAAAVAQAAGAARDLTGVCLFDEEAVSATLRPARGSRHLVQVLNLLADAAGLSPATGAAGVGTLLPLGYALAEERYPELLRPHINRFPMLFPWMSPPPDSEAQPRRSTQAFRWLFILAAFLPLVCATVLTLLFSDAVEVLAAPLLPVPANLLDVVLIAAGVSAIIFYYSLVVGFSYALPFLTGPRRRRHARWRKRLAALLAERFRLGPGGVALLLENDAEFAWHVQRFLADHHVPYPVPLYDRRGRYLFASPGKTNVLARALIRAVGKGRDNELFVLLVDLLEVVDQMDDLLRAVSVTLTRHHQVMVICPWPPGIPPPSGKKRRSRIDDRRSKIENGTGDSPSSMLDPLSSVLAERLYRAFEEVRQTFARLGVPVVCAARGDPVRLILSRLDQLRLLGLGRKR
jgi:uncharacterized protein (DUF58 family)